MTPTVKSGSWLVPPSSPEEEWFDAQPLEIRRQVADRAEALAAGGVIDLDAVKQAVSEARALVIPSQP